MPPLLTVLLLLFPNIYTNVLAEDIGFKYQFNYETKVLIRNEKNVNTVLNYKGILELQPYLLNDKKEMLVVKLILKNTPKEITILGVALKNDGLTERIYIDNAVSVGKINLLKGIISVLNINRQKVNHTEIDVSGECDVVYQEISKHLLRKYKSNCISINDDYYKENKDSFSMYINQKVYTDYVYDESGSLISLASYEEHGFEPVLFQDLSFEFSSSITLTLDKIEKAVSLKPNSQLHDAISILLGNDTREIHLPSSIEFNKFTMINSNKKFIENVNRILKRKSKNNIPLDLIRLFRKADSVKQFNEMMKQKMYSNNMKIIHDSLINCGTKQCSEIVLSILKKYIKEDNIAETIRMLIILQNIRKANDYIVSPLWKIILEYNKKIYNQGLQTISSLINLSSDYEYMNETVKSISEYIKTNLKKCEDDMCFMVHISAIKNTRFSEFYPDLLDIIMHSGKYDNKIVSATFNSIYYLNYNNSQFKSIKKTLYDVVKQKINIFNDTLLQYHSINSLILFQLDTEQLVDVLDNLVIVDFDFYYFLVKKLSKYVELGIIENAVLFSSALFKKNPLFIATYPDHKGSKVLVNQLLETNNSLVDIHFNIIGTKEGLVKHSMSDIYLVTTAQENHLFTLNTHFSGLDSYVKKSEETNEDNQNTEGLVQMTLFGKETSPYMLFEGTTGLAAAMWNAPSELTTVLDGYFYPTDYEKNLYLQNGVIINCNHITSFYLDIAFRLETSLWYKTGASLIRAQGQLDSKFDYYLVSLSTKSKKSRSLTAKVGLDISTYIDFSKENVDSCFQISTFDTKIDSRLSPVGKRVKRESVKGSCLSLSSSINQQCSKMV